MATRTVNLTVESGGYTTDGEGEWVDFYVTSGGEAFGIYEPYAIAINFSGVTSYYGSDVTHEWDIRISGDGSYGDYGDNYDTIATLQKVMHDDTADFDLSSTSLDSDAISLLKTKGLTNIGIFQIGNRKIVGKSTASAIATIYYNEPSYNWNNGPSDISVTQNNDGTFNISWKAASWQGPGTVYYYVYSDPTDERDYLVSTTDTGQNNVIIPAYGNVIIYVYGRQYDTSTNMFSSTASKSITFSAPSLNAPTISLSATKGQSVTITRGDSTVNKGSATSITYDLYRGSSKVGTFSGKTYSINQATLENWGQTNLTFKIQATATGVKPVVNNTSKLTADSNTVTFIFEPYKTILYYTGNGSINGYEECIVYYYTGNPNEGNNGWVECEPYIYTGESNATINGWQICSYT